MPVPFRVSAPPRIPTEKILLIDSHPLALAFSVSQIQEVLLKVAVIKQQQSSVTQYRDAYIPVVLGQSTSPPLEKAIVVLIKIANIKGGLVAIACTNMPKLVEITEQEWQTVQPPTGLWQSDGKAYISNQITYIHIVGLTKK